MYFKPTAKDASPLADGQTRELDGKTFDVASFEDMMKGSGDTEEKGPEVPSGIDLMGSAWGREGR